MEENIIKENKSVNYLNIVFLLILYLPLIPFLSFLIFGKVHSNEILKIILSTLFLILSNSFIVFYLFTEGFKIIFKRIDLIVLSLLPLIIARVLVLFIDVGFFEKGRSFGGGGSADFAAGLMGLFIGVVSVFYLFYFSRKLLREKSDFTWILLCIPYIVIQGFYLADQGMTFVFSFLVISSFSLSFLIFSLSSIFGSKSKKFIILSILNYLIIFLTFFINQWYGIIQRGF